MATAVLAPTGRRSYALVQTARRHPIISAEIVVVTALVLLSFVAPLLFGDPNSGGLADSLRRPWTPGHILGTDVQGRDILLRIVFAIRTSVLISLIATLAALVVGMAIGIVAGTVRGMDSVLMRVVDVQMSFPTIVLAIAAIAALGGASIANVTIVLIVTTWVVYARVARAMVHTLRGSLFVDAARATGATRWRIAYRHLIPNLLPTLVAIAVSQFPMVMIQEASLSFLGLGVPPSTPSLGVMLQEGQANLFTAWWPAAIPGVVMAIVVLMLASLGDFVSQRLNRT